VGDASARPAGLEHALIRAGFLLLDPGPPDLARHADAIIITAPSIGDTLSHLVGDSGPNGAGPPRIVVLATDDPDAPAAALALGAVDALAAPVHLPELCARVFLRIRERRSENSAGVSPTATPASMPSALSSEPGSNEEAEILERRLKEELERARRYSLSFSLILLGIDDLGDAGPSGSAAADRLRTEVANTLRRELRAPDLVVSVARDEFAIVLPETGEAGARQSVSRLRERLTRLPFEGDPRLEPTRFSAGIVTFPHPAALKTDDLFAMAEAALMRGRAQAGERIAVAM
jgi:diguanylate cyclase (GGDEF)-like protein